MAIADGAAVAAIELPAWAAPQPEMLPSLATPVLGLDPVPLQAGTPTHFDWALALVAVWLLGAALFLVRRYALYFRMRRELLADARPVGEAGRVRLVESPAADGPVAFGVIDKVIALPPGFMAMHDRTARDLALAHELAHHRGHDLLANMIVQPLFALHWFTPLAAWGWQALRRDQEAACDARVLARAPRATRAAYASVIAHFALQPAAPTRLALAAAMACPVLGDRSIVHRLKGLAMHDISPRRRWGGRVLIGTTALALPLTASISYAQSAPPRPPAVPTVPKPVIVLPQEGEDDREVRVERRIERTVERKGGKEVVTERRTYLKDGREMTAAERDAFDGEQEETAVETEDHRHELDREMAELGRELREQFAHNGELQREIRVAVAEAHAIGAQARAIAASAPRVVVRCRKGQREVAEQTVERDGRVQIAVCNSLATAEARRAIVIARTEIARTRELTDRQRAEALRALDAAERDTR